jgi:hypothetical protein
MTRHAATVSITHGQRAAVGALIAAALLIPWQVTAESSLQSGARTATAGATAHLDFRIIIPPMLALSIDSAGVPVGAAPRVNVLSNTRHVLLTASSPVVSGDRFASDQGGSDVALEPRPSGPAAPGAVDGPRHTVLLTAGRGAVIAAQTACRLGGPRPVAALGRHAGPPILDLRPVVCTVAMP